MESLITPSGAPSSRRDFFKRASLSAGVLASAAALQACDSEDNGTGDGVVLNFSNDFGVLNYAYALEQLEAAFYARVISDTAFTTTFSATAGAGGTPSEQQTFRDIAVHENIHAAFLKSALGTNAIGNLTPDFSAVNFASKASVLGTALTFEDLGVAAYNGAGKYLTDPGLLTIAGKIVSVEARHASAIRDMILNNARSGATIGESGASGIPEVVGANGLDRAFEPAAVLAAADPFIMEMISVTGIPMAT
ncbi:MAG TPA: ferritin-like domain-containing protein [Rubricoccaceae bacterium]|jgi:hypothetical protein